MGKVRVNVIGGEDEAKLKNEAEKRREAKKAAKEANKTQSQDNVALEPETEKKKVMQKKSFAPKARAAKYLSNKKLVDKNKYYPLSEALDILSQMKTASFDETVELHINALEALSGNIVLPHGTGKQTKVAILAPLKDAAGAEKLLKDIEAGKIDFDVLIATPDAMPKLAKVARVLGPKGLMPNPKNGTVTSKPEELAEKYKGGQINYKTEAKAPVLHVVVGKVSFGKAKLSENVAKFLGNLDKSKVKSVFLKSTMSPSLRLVK
jgi:large subunit ribosomal protein L1